MRQIYPASEGDDNKTIEIQYKQLYRDPLPDKEDIAAISIPFSLVRQVIWDHDDLQREHDKAKKGNKRPARDKLDYERLIKKVKKQVQGYSAGRPQSSRDSERV